MYGISFEKLEESGDLHAMAKFVVEENYNRHDPHRSTSINSEVEMIHKDEKLFQNSKIFIAKKADGSIVGCIRVLKWNFKDELPIIKIFNINPLDFVDSCSNIFHIGRFAVKKDQKKSTLLIFKTLMTFAINEVCKYSNSFAFAECDNKLLNVLEHLGIEVKILAQSKYYLGSETAPVLLPLSGLLIFLDKNKNYISSHTNVFFDSVSFNIV